MSNPLAELRSLPDDEVIRLHDAIAVHTSVGVDYYLTELARRDADRQGTRMVELTDEIRTLTGSIASMTGIVRWLTVANTVFVAIALVLTARGIGLI